MNLLGRFRPMFYIFESLENTRGANYKIALMKTMSANGLFQAVLKLTYGPYTQLYIKKTPNTLQNNFKPTSPEIFKHFLTLGKDFSSRCFTGNKAMGS